ncbi:peptidase inhibitor family I36 protein [Streptomyces sp. FXJ1.4098]|nr:peptidase inhibitor family I36 protein [Streptomyces sp. FXJ1.4098]
MRRGMRSALASVGAVAAGAVLLGTVTATTAEAASASAWYCQKGYFCSYKKDNGGGNEVWLTKANHATLPADWDKKIKSMWNDTGKYVCIYTEPRYRGRHQKLLPHVRYGANTTIRSFKFVGSSAAC